MLTDINWDDTLKKKVRAINGEDLGEVHKVTNGYVLVQKGLIHKEKFYIPQSQVESYDGSVLTFGISEEEIKRKYLSDLPTSLSSVPFTKQDSSKIKRSDSNDLSVVKKDERTKVPLTDEKLDVSKNIKGDYVNLTKYPVKETKTVQILLTREIVTIETRPPSGDIEGQPYDFSAKLMQIPFKKEVAVVKKNPYVKEEIVVKKKPVTETKEVSEETTSDERVNMPPWFSAVKQKTMNFLHIHN